MKRKNLGEVVGFVLAASGLLAGVGQVTATVNIALVPVGDAGNVADTTGYGAVNYTYNIGKYEVTAGQYTAFLNAVAKIDTYGLYNPLLGAMANATKIQRTGLAGDYHYTVAADYADRPVNYVNFWEACRFTNWLQNGQKVGIQDATTTESGVYSLNGVTNPSNTSVTRNAGWKWAVPSEDEWYKAAYYKGGGSNAGYWLYPTGSNTAPGRDLSDLLGNNANFNSGSGSYPIDTIYYTTVGGDFQNTVGACGTFDQGGNVEEWNEAILQSGTYRGLRGGTFDLGSSYMISSFRWGVQPDNFNSGNGFRVVQAVEAPEPASIGFLGLGVIGVLVRRRNPARHNTQSQTAI
ncbi:MAG: SUMF1/EgtB/PvdO family nonheme iron enzyme [Phycisphaerae bacterium]